MQIATSSYLGNLRTQSIHLNSENELITDAPKDNQGRGEAFSPTDLLATALGTCMLTIMGIKARDAGINIEGTRIEISKIMASNPRRVHTIEIFFHMPEMAYSEKERQLLKHAALNCPVAKSIHQDIEQKVVFEFQD